VAGVASSRGAGLRRIALPCALAFGFACASVEAERAFDARMPWVAQAPSHVLPEIRTNLSGISYDAARRSYLLVENNGKRIYEYEEDLRSLRRIVRLRDARNFDFEGIAALGSGRVAIVNEKNQLYVFALPAGPLDESLSLDPADPAVEFLELPKAGRWNQGGEALCFDPGVGGAGALYAFQESSPRRVFRILLSESGALQHFDEPFDAELRLAGVLRDLSGCEVDPGDGSILLLSHRSSRLARVTPSGELLGTLELPGRLSGGASQWEGVTLGPEGQLVLVSEPFFGTWPSRAQIYRRSGRPRD
jgi:uncharacterized protein YjiK